MNPKRLVPAILSQFIGSEHWYRHSLNRNISFTDGVKYVADEAGAYWLLDEIVCAQMMPAVAVEEFQVWKLSIQSIGPGPNRTAQLTCHDGDYRELYRKRILFTDFPEPDITFYFTNNVILLPSEY